MAHRRPRRRFTREYKAQAVQRLIESGRPLADIAAELDVSPGQLGQWRNEQLAAGSAEALAARKAEQAETQRLRREVKRLEEEAELRGHISRIFAAKRRVYGAPRVHAELRREGHRHARRRIEQLMRDMGLQASRGRRRKPETTNSRHDLPIAPNRLGRSFGAERPDAVWLADIL